MVDTDFRRVRRAMLRQGEGDRAPLFEISIHPDIKAGLLGRPVAGTTDEVDFWRTAGYDFVPLRAGVRSIARGYHPVVKEWLQNRLGADYDPAMAGWISGDTAIIRNRQDFERFPWPAPEALGGYNDYEDMADYLAELIPALPPEMKLVPVLGYFFMGATEMMGFENFCLTLYDDLDLVRAVIDRLGASQMAVLEMLLQYDCVGAVWIPDDLCYNSGPITQPRFYEQLVYPWYVKMIERCHRADLPIGLHSDGDLAKLLPGLIECGFDAIHPFEPPMNDIVAIKKKWGHRIAVAGNIDLKETLIDGTPADVEAEVRHKAALLKPGGGWLVSSSNSIPDFVPLENYRALLAGGLKYGRYR